MEISFAGMIREIPKDTAREAAHVNAGSVPLYDAGLNGKKVNRQSMQQAFSEGHLLHKIYTSRIRQKNQ